MTSHIISTDEDPGLRIESFAVINLRGVSTNKTIICIQYRNLVDMSYVWDVLAWNMIGLMALRNVGVDCLHIAIVLLFLPRSLNIVFRNLYFMSLIY